MPQATGNLTIFSEDGDKFFLILNGEKQNTVAQTNLRVEDLPQQYYNAKIIFEDKAIPDVSKDRLMIADFNGTFMDVTYKIKKDKNNGSCKLKYFSMVPIQQGFVPPANCYVVHSGRPQAPMQQQVVVEQNVPVQQTTVTRSTTTNNNAALNMNVGGMGVNVSINDPAVQTTTTTTTISSSSTSGGYTSAPVQQAPVGCNGQYPMNPSDFSNALKTVSNEGFDETRLSTAKQIASSNCLSTGQITQICKTFGFEETKLSFAKYAYEFCTDRKNYFNVNNVFGFSSSKEELNSYIQSYR
jgi:hypothetical protein